MPTSPREGDFTPSPNKKGYIDMITTTLRYAAEKCAQHYQCQRYVAENRVPAHGAMNYAVLISARFCVLSRCEQRGVSLARHARAAIPNRPYDFSGAERGAKPLDFAAETTTGGY